METRTVYVPANHFGRNVLTLIWQQIPCSMGSIQKVDRMLRVAITMPKRNVHALDHILQKFDLA